MAKLYRYQPAGLDLYDRRPPQPEPGSIVRKVQPSGCPRNGTMGHCFVGDPDQPYRSNGVLVLEASLLPVDDVG